MSKTVDQRVVEMEFNNKEFEKNAAQSMSTIEKLKSKLDFSGSAKAMKELNGSVKDVNMSPLASAAEAVKDKFSILEQIGIGALRKIGEEAVATGERLVKSLSVDNIKDGWDKFGKKTEAVATLVSQGYDISVVNEQMELLNWYTDETSYNFTSMASEIGKFTASGQSLEDSVTAMMGIADWAALSGQNATKASAAMYQLSQAMSKGALKYDDWRSVQNAGMDTREFRQNAVDAAIALGQVKKVGDDLYAVMEDVNGVATEAARYTLNEMFTSDAMSKKGWLDSEAMMSVFTKYGQAVKSLRVITDNEVDGLETASEAMAAVEEKAEEMVKEANAAGKELSMDDALRQASLEMVGSVDSIKEEAEEYIATIAQSEGRSIDFNTALTELGYGFDSFALKALRSAQEAKTWADVIDATKDAVSTGWMNTFEKIFGDYETAKSLWTRSANDFYDIFASAGEERNEMLDVWSKMGGQKLLFSTDEEDLGALLRILDMIKNVMSTIKEAEDEIFYSFTNGGSVAEQKGVRLFRITKKIADAIKSFTDKFKEGSENLEKLKRTFKGIFAIVDVIKTVVRELFSAIGQVFGELFGEANGGILDLTANIGDALVAFRDWIKESGVFKIVFGGIANTIINVIRWIKQFIAWIQSIPLVQNAVNAIRSAFDSLKNSIGELYERVKGGEGIGQVLGDMFKDVRIIQDIKNFFKGIWDAIVGFWNNFVEVPEKISQVNTFLADVFVNIGNTINTFLTNMGVAAIDFGKIFESIKNIFENLTINDVAMIAAGVAIFLFVRRLFSALEVAGGIVESFNNLTKAVKGFFSGIKKTLQAHAVLVMAGAILVLVAALSVLATQDPDRLWSAVGIMATLIGVVSALFIAVGIIGPRLATATVAIIGLSAAMALLSVALMAISNSNTSGLAGAIAALLAVSAAFVLIGAISTRIVSTQKGVMQSMIGLAVMLVGVGLSMTLIAVAMKKIAEIDTGDISKVGTVMLEISIGMAAMLAASSFVRKGAGGTILAMAVSLFLILGAIRKLAKMDPAEAARGLTMVQKILIIFAATIALMNIMSGNLNLVAVNSNVNQGGGKGAGGTIMALVAAIYGIIGAIAIIGLIPKNVIDQGMASISIIMGLFAVIILVSRVVARSTRTVSKEGDKAKEQTEDATNDISQVGTLLLKLAAALIGVAAALTVMTIIAHFDPDALTQSAIILGALMAVMAVIVGLSGLAKDSEKALSAINVMIITLAITVGALAIINPPIDKIIAISAGFAAILAALGFVILAANRARKAKSSLIVLSVIIAMISAILIMMSFLPLNNVLENASSLGVVMLALAGALAIITKFVGEVPLKELAKAYLTITVLTIITAGLAFILYKLSAFDVQTSLMNVAALAILMAEIAGVLFVMSKTGKIATSAIVAVAVVSVCFAILGAVLWGMSALNVQNAITNALALSILMGDILALLLVSIVVGKFAAAASAGLVLILKVMGVMALIVAAAGALMEWTALGDVMKDGAEFMRLFGEAIGAFFGGIAAGYQKAISDALPKMSEDMATFYTNLSVVDDPNKFEKFVQLSEKLASMPGSIPTGDLSYIKEVIAIMPSFSDELVSAYKKFSNAELDVTKLDVVADVTNAMVAVMQITPEIKDDKTGGIKEFGEQMVDYADSLETFNTTVSGIEFDQEKIDAAVDAGKKVAELGHALTGKNGFTQWFEGTKDVSEFGTQMSGYADGVLNFINKLCKGRDITLYSDKVDAAVDAGMKVATLANSIPGKNGFMQWFNGEQDVNQFGSQMSGYADGVRNFINKLCKNGRDITLYSDKVDAAVEAGLKVADLAHRIPGKNGLKQWFEGTQDINDFGDQMSGFADGVVKFNEKIKDEKFNTDLAQKTATIASMLANVATGLPVIESDVWGFWFGKKTTLSEFSTGVDELGKGISKFSQNTLGIDPNSMDTATTALLVLTAIENNLPESDGAFTWLTGGGRDVDGFCADLPKFGEAIKKFSDKITAEGGIDSAAVGAAGSVLQGVAALSNVQSLGGVVEITKDLVPIAENLIDFYDVFDSVEDFNDTAVNTAISAIEALDYCETHLWNSTFERSKAAVKELENLIGLINRASKLDDTKLEALDKTLTAFANSGYMDFLKKFNNETTATQLNDIAIGFVSALTKGAQSEGDAFANVFTNMIDTEITTIKGKTTEYRGAGQYVAEQILDGLQEKLDTDASTRLSESLNSEGFQNSINVDAIGGSIGDKINSVVNVKDMNMDSLGGDLMGDIFKGMGNFDVSTLMGNSTLDSITGTFGSVFDSNEITGSLTDIGSDSMGSIFSGMGDFDVNSFLNGDSLDSITGKFTDVFSSNAATDTFGNIGSDAMSDIFDGMGNFDISKMLTASETGEITGKLTGIFKADEVKAQFEDTGKDASQGFIDGALSKKLDIQEAGKKVAEAYEKGITDKLDIHSPSKETFKLGGYAGQGFLNALSQFVKKAYQSGSDISDSALTGMMKAVNEAAYAFDAETDITPVITPVVDMSDIDKSAQAINDVFGTDSTFALAGEVSAAMGDFSTSSVINVDNHDVVDELDKLRSDMRLMADKMSKFQVYLDTGALVGNLADPMDSALGARAVRRRRG